MIPLYSDKDEESNIPVKFLSKKINATSGTITTLYFHDTSRWIISGDQQGNGKINKNNTKSKNKSIIIIIFLFSSYRMEYKFGNNDELSRWSQRSC